MNAQEQNTAPPSPEGWDAVAYVWIENLSQQEVPGSILLLFVVFPIAMVACAAFAYAYARRHSDKSRKK